MSHTPGRTRPGDTPPGTPEQVVDGWMKRALATRAAPARGGAWASDLELAKNLLDVAWLRSTVDHDGDTLPANRKQRKLLHAMGCVGKVRWRAVESPYSGLLGSDAVGLVRFSLANRKSFAPGLALKFPTVDGGSLNVLGLPSLQGVPIREGFFARAFKTWLSMPSENPDYAIQAAFQKVVPRQDALRLPMDILVERAQDPTARCGDPVPYGLVFRPDERLDARDERREFRAALESVEPGPLFSVEALARRPRLRIRGTRVADIHLEGPLVSSLWGDTELFFQHHYR